MVFIEKESNLFHPSRKKFLGTSLYMYTFSRFKTAIRYVKFSVVYYISTCIISYITSYMYMLFTKIFLHYTSYPRFSLINISLRLNDWLLLYQDSDFQQT